VLELVIFVMFNIFRTNGVLGLKRVETCTVTVESAGTLPLPGITVTVAAG
jgi:hypothetical protein